MNKVLQLVLLAGSIIVLFVVLRFVIKNKMNIRFAIIWVIWSLAMIIISIFPSIIYSISNLLGFEKPVNAIFLLMVFLLYCLSFYLFVSISKHNDEILNLNYEIAALKKKIEELENEKQ